MSRLFPSPAWSPQRPSGARAAPSQSPLEAQEADRLFRVHSTDFGRAAVGRGCRGRGRGLACHTGHLCHDHAPPVQSPGGAPCCRPPGVATALTLAIGAGRWPLGAGQRRPRPQPGASLRGESSRDSADSGWGFPGPSGSLVQTERPEMDRTLHRLPPRSSPGGRHRRIPRFCLHCRPALTHPAVLSTRPAARGVAGAVVPSPSACCASAGSAGRPMPAPCLPSPPLHQLPSLPLSLSVAFRPLARIRGLGNLMATFVTTGPRPGSPG